MEITRDNITNNADPIYDVDRDLEILVFDSTRVIKYSVNEWGRLELPLFDKSIVNENKIVAEIKSMGCQDCVVVTKNSQMGIFGLRKKIGN